MSQADLLEEMSGWSPETCQRELPAALPQLCISLFQCSENWNEKIRLFKIITEMFLPHVHVLELEQDVFVKLLPQAVEHFHNLLSEISRQALMLSSQNTDEKNTLRNTFQEMSHWIAAFTACVRHVCSIEEAVHFENIQSLPSSVLQILTATFTHCKDGDSVYFGRLHLVSNLLQALFKEAVTLEKQLMELLDKTTISASTSVTEITGMVCVVHTFLDICVIVSKMDHAVHANIWKFIIKQTVKHHALVQNQLRHDKIVRFLCDDILLSFQSCLNLAEHMKLTGTQITDQRLFQKTVKLCRFFANSLVHYTKEFIQFLAGSCVSFHQMYLQIHSLFPPSLFATPMCDIHKNELNSVCLGVFEDLILQLLTFRPFMELVLSKFQDLPPEHHLPHCLILIHTMNKLPTLPDELQILWCTSSKSPARMSIFQAVLQSFARCSPEIALPVVLQDELGKGQNPTTLTFYQYVCTRVCACIVLLPPGCFADLERSLLCAVLSNRMLESLLAIDVWCFLARYGTAELCAHHVYILALLVKSSPRHAYQLTHLTVLLRRLLFLMDADNQVEFIKKFSPAQEGNLSFWQHVSLLALPSTLTLQVQTGLFTAALSQCRKLLKSKFITEDIQQLNVSLSALLTACHSFERHLNTQQQRDVMDIISQLLSLISMKQIAEQPLLLETTCRFLDLFEFVIKKVEPPMLRQVISLISSLCQEDAPSHVKLTVLNILLLLGRIIIPREIQVAVLSNVSVLFSMLLSDKMWIVKQHALEAFTQFAEETSYEQIVPQSLTSEETKNYVVCFLNKNILLTEEDNIRLQRLKNEKQVLESFFSKTEMKRKDEPVSTEPSAKRPRQDTFTDEEFQAHIKAAEKSLNFIQSLLQEKSTPQWLPEKLSNIQRLLTKIQTTAEKR
ncbi:FIGNL1-interacting regulator of recombination and mitosis isoform X2 [Ranitomeya imitator]|uniref:FIGNL1-interacting regulator of recombination and mitosis isoform X2 n=1 Tax=Ranitomeya imitator TaxID=111125 RepID=UPI0037E8F276